MLAPTLAGTLFLAGGHVLDQDADLWKAFVAHASSPTIAVFGSARGSLKVAREAFEQDSPDAWSYRHVLQHYGARPRFVPIAIDNFRQAAHDPANVKLVEQCGGVFFGGGAQDLHARCLLEDDGRDTPLMAAVRKVYAKGGVVGGTSAGAAVMDRLTYGDGESADYLKANRLVQRPLTAFGKADTPMGDGKTGGYTTGFGFTAGVDAAVDTHVDARGRYGRVLVAMGQLGYRFGIALAENTALAIRGQDAMAYGAGSVVVFDGRQAQISKTGPFTARNVGASVLHAHDAYDFTRGEATTTRHPSPGPMPSPPANVLDHDALPRLIEAFQASNTPALRCPAPAAQLVFTLRRARTTLLDVEAP
jgi:cyanophycinase